MNGARNGTRTRDPELGKYAYLIEFIYYNGDGVSVFNVSIKPT